MNVLAKLRSLPAPAKIAAAALVAGALGLIGYAVLGDVGAGVFGLGGIFSAIGALFGSDPDAELAADLLRAEAERLDRDADRDRDEAEARARRSSEARSDAAMAAARAALNDDDDDPRRVLDRLRDGTAGDD
ncbi:MAG TPA: hypothetical protein ENH33_00595 [Actinobacteria bacterium]|nr:hypothetical protein [Actinomycetota bacterium]